jgi:hypothetical protein
MARAVLTDRPKVKTKSITQSDYPLVKIAEGKRLVKIQQTLPFRVRFINITVPGYSFPNNVPPIGIAIIGFNNYIL